MALLWWFISPVWLFACRYKVYTKTGDKGESSLYNGERRPKTDPIFVALGDVDELNAAIGVVREYVEADSLGQQLVEIQSRLLDVGSAIATPLTTSSQRKASRSDFGEGNAGKLEGWIDEMDATLPQLTSFILPSGGKASAHLHVARAVCRRAERAVALLPREDVGDDVNIYLNRLSDYLFMAARFAASPGSEQPYKKGQP
jgi:cob(I)alamin adenosyltransferase